MKSQSLLALSAFILALATTVASAEEIKGKLKAVDSEKGTITLEVGAADQVFPVAADMKVVGLFGKKIKKAKTQDIKDGLKGVKIGSEVTLTTENRDQRDVVSKVSMDGLQAKVKKKKKKA